MFKKTGQSTLEYTVLIVVIIGALLAASDYIKRGIQGRWKSAVDDLGDQYDPRTAKTDIIYAYVGNSDMKITTFNTMTGGVGSASSGVYTFRTDSADSLEIKQGSTTVGSN